MKRRYLPIVVHLGDSPITTTIYGPRGNVDDGIPITLWDTVRHARPGDKVRASIFRLPKRVEHPKGCRRPRMAMERVVLRFVSVVRVA